MANPSDSIVCPSCGKSYAYKAALAGKRVKCKCGGVITVPAAAASEEPEAAPPGFDDMDFGGDAADAPPATPMPPASKRAAQAAPVARGADSPAKKEDSWKWWQYVGGGVLVAGLGVFEFIRLGQLENGEVESVRVAHWEAFIYRVFGRWGLLIVALVLAMFIAGVGIHQFMQRRKAQA